MKLTTLCLATLLLASGAWGQHRIGEPEHVCRWALKGGGYEYNACPPAKQEKKSPPVLGNATVVDDLSYHIRWNGVEAVTVPCHDTPAKQEKKSPCSSNGVVTTCDAPAWMTKQEEKVPAMSSKGDGWIFTQEPFDVPPKETDTPEKYWGIPVPNHHRTCADQKRVLLMSEDKVWHCYLFEEQP